MSIEIDVPEIVNLFNKIQGQPQKVLETVSVEAQDIEALGPSLIQTRRENHPSRAASRMIRIFHLAGCR